MPKTSRKKSQSKKQSPALRYHELPVAGKLSVEPSKSCATQNDLSKAYTPGVAEPVRAIAKDPTTATRYTNRGNLVAVISNGTAVLGLGNVGALASKPVMEGKSVLFKRFAGVDAFDIELDLTDPKAMVDAIAAMEPTFGGINLEDIKAPECFYIEDELKKRMNIPVFHDDQHGTPIIAGAALLNALKLNSKNIADIRIVISGAGAAGLRCAEHFIRLGAKAKNILVCDSRGVITTERKKNDKRIDEHKAKVARATSAETLEQALLGADVFVGVSAPDIVTADMVRTMAKDPIVFALANPNPEISYRTAIASRPDIIMATGRSDHPNQINNVLGFPFVFRGALDVHATDITDGMKVAATIALAELAHKPVPTAVIEAYKLRQLKFGKDYIVPKPFDARVLEAVAGAVAKAAMVEGVAKQPVDLVMYRKQLARMSKQLQKRYA